MLTIARALVALLAIAVPISAAAAPPAKPRFESPQHILQWINTYRLKPEPGKVPDAVRAMSALGLFRDLDAGGVYLGFIAGVIGSNPATADTLVSRMFPMPPEDQVVLVRAIAYSGLPAWKPLLQRFAERMPARKVLIDRHLTDKLPSLETLPLDQTPAALDVMWGYYFATGRFGSIDRIVSALAWAKDQNNVERLTLGSMAKWTLAQNAQADKALLEHLKGSAKAQSKEISKELDEIVEAAETFETTRIRRDALAAIEELKRKGPASARNISWWGQAGQTALAVGCVVASALGQIQVGIPCVIGGAASSAALRFLAPQP
jgi:hypothetical protein